MRHCLFFLLTLNIACKDKSDSCYPVDGIEQGTATLSLDGEALEYEATWLMAGSSLQLNLENGQSSMTIRLTQTDDGKTIEEIGETSAVFSIGNPENGTATLYPSASSASATISSEDPGLFTLDSFDENTLTGCFDFTAEAGDGTTYQVSTGLVHAAESELN